MVSRYQTGTSSGGGEITRDCDCQVIVGYHGLYHSG